MKSVPGLSLFLLLVTILVGGCVSSPSYPRVSLVEPLPDSAPTRASDNSDSVLRVAIAAVISPRSTAQSYTLLVNYIGQQVGRQVQMVQGRTYIEVNNFLRDGYVDLAFVCSGAYVQGHDDFGMEILAVPEVGGETWYYSNIITPARSSVRQMTDLRGRTFAFTDPLSNSGWLLPVLLLHELGETPDKFFAHTIYTYSHDNSIQAVADGLVDGAGVDSLVYSFALSQDPGLADRTRVIARLGPSAMPPVVVHPGLDTAQKTALQNVLLTMHQDESGRKALAPLFIDRFVTLEDRAYDSIRDALRQIRETS